MSDFRYLGPDKRKPSNLSLGLLEYRERAPLGLSKGTILHVLIVVLMIGFACFLGYYTQQTDKAQARERQSVVTALQTLQGTQAALQRTIQAEQAQQQQAATMTAEQLLATYPHHDIMLRIWTLESSRGRAPLLVCQRRGLVSDMGFNALGRQCFASHKDEFDTVNAWLDKTLADHPLANTLCIYNEGRDVATCPYARNFMGI